MKMGHFLFEFGLQFSSQVFVVPHLSGEGC